MQIADCGLRIADCRLQFTVHRLQITDYRSQIKKMRKGENGTSPRLAGGETKREMKFLPEASGLKTKDQRLKTKDQRRRQGDWGTRGDCGLRVTDHRSQITQLNKSTNPVSLTRTDRLECSDPDSYRNERAAIRETKDQIERSEIPKVKRIGRPKTKDQ